MNDNSIEKRLTKLATGVINRKYIDESMRN